MRKIYESPDGVDCLEKTLDTAYRIGKVGFIISIYDCIGGAKLRSVAPVIGRIGYWTGPAALLGAGISSGICISSHLRGGKDDFINHAVGGAVAAGVFGLRLGPTNGALLVPVFASIMAIVRLAVDDGAKLPGKYEHAIKEVGFTGNNDFSIGPRANYKKPEY